MTSTTKFTSFHIITSFGVVTGFKVKRRWFWPSVIAFDLPAIMEAVSQRAQVEYERIGAHPRYFWCKQA